MKLRRHTPSGGSYRYDRRLDDGEYEAVVLAATETCSRQGNPMIVLSLGIEGPWGPAKVEHFVVLHLLDRVEELLRALSHELLDQWQRHGECNLDVASLVGKRCQVSIRVRSWGQGPVRPRVEYVLPF